MTPNTENMLRLEKNYVVVRSHDLDALVMDVNDVIATGEWTLSGGISTAPVELKVDDKFYGSTIHTKVLYMQALVKIKH